MSTAPSSSGYTNYWKTQQFGNSSARSSAEKTISKALNDLDLPADWLQDVSELVARESGYNPKAKNPSSSAAGLFQFLDGTREEKAYNKGITDWSDPYQQTLAGLRRIKARYGTPKKALEFWDENKWY